MISREENSPEFTIRLASGQDAERIVEIYAPEVRETVISFEVVPPTVDEMRERIEETLQRFPWLVCELDGQVVGYAYAGSHRSRTAYQWCVDVSAYIHKDARRSGVGRALYTSLFSTLVLQGYFNAYAGIALPNPASVGMHESAGFHPVGIYREVGYKFGGWHDVGWWQLSLQERASEPSPPVPLAAIKGSRGWEEALSSGHRLLRDQSRNRPD